MGSLMENGPSPAPPRRGEGSQNRPILIDFDHSDTLIYRSGPSFTTTSTFRVASWAARSTVWMAMV